MAYDAARGRTVLFGGIEAGPIGGNGETWEWDGTAWTQRFVAGPSGRYSHAMVYDAARAVTVLFGGRAADVGRSSGQTWEWDGAHWTQRAVSGPSPRYYHAMAYDKARAATVLFGGRDENIGPSQRIRHAMAYDARRAVTVLFGGTRDDTWELGCAGVTISSEPGSGVICSVYSQATLSASVTGGGTFSYQWQWRTVPGSAWVDVIDGVNRVSPDADIESFFRVLVGGSC